MSHHPFSHMSDAEQRMARRLISVAQSGDVEGFIALVEQGADMNCYAPGNLLHCLFKHSQHRDKYVPNGYVDFAQGEEPHGYKTPEQAQDVLLKLLKVYVVAGGDVAVLSKPEFAEYRGLDTFAYLDAIRVGGVAPDAESLKADGIRVDWKKRQNALAPVAPEAVPAKPQDDALCAASRNGEVKKVITLLEGGEHLTPAMLNAAMEGYGHYPCHFGLESYAMEASGPYQMYQWSRLEQLAQLYAAGGGDIHAWLEQYAALGMEPDAPRGAVISYLRDIANGSKPLPTQESLAEQGIEIDLAERSRALSHRAYAEAQEQRIADGVFLNEDGLRAKDCQHPFPGAPELTLSGPYDREGKIQTLGQGKSHS